jgi:hypothetical protein
MGVRMRTLMGAPYSVILMYPPHRCSSGCKAEHSLRFVRFEDFDLSALPWCKLLLI